VPQPFAQSARSVFPDVTIQLLRRIQKTRGPPSRLPPVDLLVTGVSLPDGDVIDFLAENSKMKRGRFMRVMVVTEHREPARIAMPAINARRMACFIRASKPASDSQMRCDLPLPDGRIGLPGCWRGLQQDNRFEFRFHGA